MSSLFDHIPKDLPEEHVDTLLEHRGVRVERIVSRGHSTPEGVWYCQDTDEWVLLVQGEAALEYRSPEGHTRLRAGDWLFIPAGRQHRVSWTAHDQDTIWLALHWTGDVAGHAAGGLQPPRP
ncbi:cupin domain-containing protein [Thioalkalivibrio thiocyanodenitrificans]|uniref:cupin domain-containing protein n=1 Tax=Thioalkalivibrio thiocyanodenitrificans TaxID=243063 RepID=UPI0003739D7F|nr:cupin domain-containing protein [Thioalkalivibrio thiocyanodenitrificans]